MSGFLSAGIVGGPDIPDSVVNRAPLDEGSGTSFADVVGDASGSLDNGGTWTSNSAFEGETAPTFDQSNIEGGSWNPRATAPVTYTFRVRADSDGLQTGDSSNHIFNFSSYPRVFYNTTTDEWTVSDGADNRASLSESQSTLEGSIRVVAFRLDSNSCDLDVYQEDATTKVGSASISSPNTSFDNATMEISKSGNGSAWGDVIDLMDAHDTALSDSELDSVVADLYG